MKRDDFARSLNGLAGEFDAWLECNNEQEVKDAINCYVSSCAAHYEAERNSLLAVIAEKDKALKYARDSISHDQGKRGYMDDWSLITDALALTSENVRLVEYTEIWTDSDNLTLYTIETTETNHSFIEAKGG